MNPETWLALSLICLIVLVALLCRDSAGPPDTWLDYDHDELLEAYSSHHARVALAQRQVGGVVPFPSKRSASMTHYIPVFTKIRGRGKYLEEQAACGPYVKPSLHSNEPTCEACQAYLTASDAVAARIQREYDEERGVHVLEVPGA